MFERHIEDELVQVLKEEGMGCIIFSPLAQGLLTEKYLNGIPNDTRAVNLQSFLKKEYITEEKIFKVRGLLKIADKWG